MVRQENNHSKSYAKRIIENGLLQAEIDHTIGQILPNSSYVSSYFYQKAGYQIKILTKKSFAVNNFSVENRNMIRLALAQRLDVPVDKITLVIKQVVDNTLNAAIMADRVKDMLKQGISARRAAQSVIRSIMSSPSKPMGAEIIISGKLRGQRAKPAKFTSGVILHTGDFVKDVVNSAVRHVSMHVGVIGVKVKICCAPSKEMRVPDFIEISKGKEVDDTPITPSFNIDLKNFPNQLTEYLKQNAEVEQS